MQYRFPSRGGVARRRYMVSVSYVSLFSRLCLFRQAWSPDQIDTRCPFDKNPFRLACYLQVPATTWHRRTVRMNRILPVGRRTKPGIGRRSPQCCHASRHCSHPPRSCGSIPKVYDFDLSLTMEANSIYRNCVPHPRPGPTYKQYVHKLAFWQPEVRVTVSRSQHTSPAHTLESTLARHSTTTHEYFDHHAPYFRGSCKKRVEGLIRLKRVFLCCLLQRTRLRRLVEMEIGGAMLPHTSKLAFGGVVKLIVSEAAERKAKRRAAKRQWVLTVGSRCAAAYSREVRALFFFRPLERCFAPFAPRPFDSKLPGRVESKRQGALTLVCQVSVRGQKCE